MDLIGCIWFKQEHGMYINFLKEIEDYVNHEDIKMNEMMQKHTSFRVGGPAKIFLTIRSREILRKIILSLKNFYGK